MPKNKSENKKKIEISPKIRSGIIYACPVCFMESDFDEKFCSKCGTKFRE